MKAGARDVCLPRLRPELQLLRGAPNVHGEPAWLIHDPLSNRFIQIDAGTYEALRRWHDGLTARELVALTAADQSVALDDNSLGALIDFLHANQLTCEAKTGGWRHFAKSNAARGHSPVGFLIHNYLFFRIPLCRPQAFLQWSLPAARLVWSPLARWLISLMGVTGLYLVSRQWDQFTSTFQSFFTFEGALLTALVLCALKSAHELGHAYTAANYGCRVHTMGLAFVVMAPMFYTDVTDSWRLTDRRQRFAIDMAGIAVEAAIAAVALFAWSFLPDGQLRGMAFLICTVSVVSSLAINLNPFMRFDGYYLLSEAAGVENMQSRAFALCRWKLREWLFDIGAPCPEELPKRLEAFLIVYAWAIWIYRVTLFVGIALLVYHYFFKVLGVVLFAVEIIFFVARPVMSELSVWYRLRQSVLSTRRTAATAAVAGSALAIALVPWSSRVEIPAVVESGKLQTVYAERSARLIKRHVAHGARVHAGDPIVTLASPELDQDLRLARISLESARLQFARRMSDATDREGSLVLESTMLQLQSKIAGLETEAAEMTIAAPFEATIVDLNPELIPGRWLASKEPIATLASDTFVIAKGYLMEADLARIKEGAAGSFIPESPLRSQFQVKIEKIASAGSNYIEIPDLASAYSGRIAVNPDEKHRLVPTSAHYHVLMSARGKGLVHELSFRGVVLAKGEPESVLARIWRQALSVIVRESGV